MYKVSRSQIHTALDFQAAKKPCSAPSLQPLAEIYQFLVLKKQKKEYMFRKQGMRGGRGHDARRGQILPLQCIQG
jgi:hypothetical protein